MHLTSKDNQTMTTAFSGMLQVKAYRILRSDVNEVLSKYDISLAEWAIICEVNRNKRMRLSVIADFLDVESPLVTNLVDQLLKKKLVIRKEDKNDKRAKVVTLSKNAINKLPAIEENLREKMANLLKDIDEKDLEIYFKVLKCIVDNGG